MGLIKKLKSILRDCFTQPGEQDILTKASRSGYTKLSERNKISEAKIQKILASNKKDFHHTYPLENRVHDSYLILSDFVELKSQRLLNTLFYMLCHSLTKALEQFVPIDSHNANELCHVKIICMQKIYGGITEDAFCDALGVILESQSPLEDDIIELFWNNELYIWRECRAVNILGMLNITLKLLDEHEVYAPNMRCNLKAIEKIFQHSVGQSEPVSELLKQYTICLSENLIKSSLSKEPCFGFNIFTGIGLFDTLNLLLENISKFSSNNSLPAFLDYFEYNYDYAYETYTILSHVYFIEALLGLANDFYSSTHIQKEFEQYCQLKNKQIDLIKNAKLLFPKLSVWDETA